MTVPSCMSKHDQLPTRCDMSLPMQWMALICRATFSGLFGQRIIPSGVLMHGKDWVLQFRPKTTLADSRMSGVDHRQVLGSLHPAVRR